MIVRREEDWRQLRVGDKVRIVRFPSDWGEPGWHVDPSTRELYGKLIARRRPVRVFLVDEFGQPWIQGRASEAPGHWWTLAIADDSWIRVRQRGGRCC